MMSRQKPAATTRERTRTPSMCSAVVLVLLCLGLSAVDPAQGFAVPAAAVTRRSSRASEPLSASASSHARTCAGADDCGWEVAAARRTRASVRASFSSVKALSRRRDGLSVQASPLPDAAKRPPSEPERQPELVYGETAARSFVKALVWRLTAAVITLVSGLVFSGSLSTAMRIVGSDFITKSGFMFAGERLWNKVKWGQGKTGDSAKRSLAKAVLWRVFAASNTLICGIFLARDLSVASKIAGSDTIFKTALFFANERIWSLVKWGKRFEPEYFI